MFSVLFWGAFSLLFVQFAASFAAAVTTSERDNAWLSKAAAGVSWLVSATGRAGALSGAWVRARYDALRARKAGRAS